MKGPVQELRGPGPGGSGTGLGLALLMPRMDIGHRADVLERRLWLFVWVVVSDGRERRDKDYVSRAET